MNSDGALSPVRLFLKVILLVFVAEAGVMFMLARFPPMSEFTEAVLDATSLSIILSPCLWWWLVVESRRRQQVERELEFQRRALDLHALVSETDAAGHITYASDLFCRVSGYSREELLGQKHRIINSGYHPPEFWRQAYAELASRGEWHGEVCNRAKDGRFYWVSSTIVAFKDPEGKILRYVSIRTEITKRKQVEEQLDRARTSAEAANQAKGEFLAVMSHEIRTPLNAVLGFTDLLTETTLSDLQRDYVRTIRQSGSSLLSLINDILDYSKIEAGKLTLELMPFDIRQACEDVLELLGSKAHAKGLEIALIAHPMPLGVVADPARIRQVLTNLLGNAIKFTSAGAVKVRIQPILSTDEPGRAQEVEVQVHDTGIGIPADKQHLLFKKFTQTDASTTRKFGGTGLGLAISKQLIESMHGKIGMSSGEGKGTCFWFRLPLPDSPVELPELGVAPLKGTECKVLSISRSVPNQEALRAILDGWRVSFAMVGEVSEASSRAASDFDLILLDVRTLGAESPQVAEGLRVKLGLAAERLVVCTSAFSESQLGGYGPQLRLPLLRPSAIAAALDAALSEPGGSRTPEHSGLSN